MISNKYPKGFTKIIVKHINMDEKLSAYWYADPEGTYCRAFLWVPHFNLGYAWTVNPPVDDNQCRMVFVIKTEDQLWDIFNNVVEGNIFTTLVPHRNLRIQKNNLIGNTPFQYIVEE